MSLSSLTTVAGGTVARRPQSKVFLPYPQAKKCGVIAKLDQLPSLPIRGGGFFVFAFSWTEAGQFLLRL
jgi:hypothetical protein